MTAPTRPRVVYAWPYASLGGSQIYLLKVAALVRDDYDVVVVMPRSASPALVDYWRAIGADIRFVATEVDERIPATVLDRARRRLRQWRTELAVARVVLAEAHARTVLHLDFAPWTSYWLLRLLLARHPVCVTLHTRMPRPGRLRANVWARKLTALARHGGFQVIAASAHVRDSLGGYLPDEARARIPIAYSPVDLDEIDAALAAPVADRRAGVAVVTVGQFIDRKGPWPLLEAVARLAAAGIDARFLWLCPTPPTPVQQARIDAAGLGSRFAWRAFDQPGDSRMALLAAVRAADIFVLPSLEEGLPLAIVEAMALGRPVVATRTNGVPEAITHGVDGLLVEPGDADGLAQALVTLCRDADTRQVMGAAAADRARGQFGSRETARVVAQVYATLLARWAGR